MNPARYALRSGQSVSTVALFFALLGAAAPAASHAQTMLVDDQFIDGGVTNGADALDAGWTSSSASTNPVATGAFATSGNTSSALVKTAGGGSANTFNVLKGAFANSTALTTGGSITLSFDLRFSASPAASNAGLRIGLGTASSSHLFQLGTGGTASGNFVYYTTADTGAGTAAGTFNSAPSPTFSISDTLSHAFSLTLTRTGASSLAYSVTIDGTTYTSASNVALGAFTFDRILIGEGGNAMSYNLDNVLVYTGVIPEPSSAAALAGLASLGMIAAVKRRRNKAASSASGEE